MMAASQFGVDEILRALECRQSLSIPDIGCAAALVLGAEFVVENLGRLLVAKGRRDTYIRATK